MNELIVVLTAAVFVESLIEAVKPLWDKEKGWNLDALISLGLSIVVCLVSGADLFKLVGLSVTVPYVGSVLTGVIVARGSNFVHDLLKKLNIIANTAPAPPASPASFITPPKNFSGQMGGANPGQGATEAPPAGQPLGPFGPATPPPDKK